MTTAVGQGRPRQTRDRFNKFVYFICRVLFSSYLRAFHRYEVLGREHLPRTGGGLLVANHASFLDPLVVGCATWQQPILFLARNTLFAHSRFLQWWSSAVGTVLVDRERGDIRAIKQALDLVQRGHLLCLFPEGTRTADGRLQPVKAGIGFLIEKSGVPVIPTYIGGTFQAMPRGARWIKACKITVAFGPPITAADCRVFQNERDRHQKIADLVMARIASLCYGAAP